MRLGSVRPGGVLRGLRLGGVLRRRGLLCGVRSRVLRRGGVPLFAVLALSGQPRLLLGRLRGLVGPVLLRLLLTVGRRVRGGVVRAVGGGVLVGAVRCVGAALLPGAALRRVRVVGALVVAALLGWLRGGVRVVGARAGAVTLSAGVGTVLRRLLPVDGPAVLVVTDDLRLTSVRVVSVAVAHARDSPSGPPVYSARLLM
ncbi:hypothetical protein STAL104432_29320 [Streptomyces albus]